ncbi:helix-turn-helix domain-containing protein [Cohnella suwonensis]|uniref:Helix-turn-helix domain-containing protein n=1 Tax=Cohnella suwonensis TaxID=696072 RepID=A0ABW0M2N9_9BACL
MYKVFIVDDELLVIKSLIASMRWEEYGFEIAGHALSGTEAFEEISRLKPDLVFTDIRMPGIGGLELIRNLKNAANQALFVIISGYAEFALAQKAIHYGAFGYCLKPFDDEEIASYLKKARTLLKNRQPSLDAELLDMLEDGESSIEELRTALLARGVDLGSGDPYLAVVVLGKSKQAPEGWKNAVSLRIGYGKTAYLIREMSLTDALRNGTEGETIKGIGASDPFRGLGQIKEAIESAEERAYRYFVTGREGLLTDADAEPSSPELTIQLNEAVASQDRAKLRTLLEQVRALFSDGRLTIKDALIIYNRVQQEETIFTYDKLARTFGDAQEMLDELLRGLGREATHALTKNRLIGPIQDYIKMHFQEDVSIHDISAKFSINPNYFSQLFKKEVGLTFTEYVTTLRVQHACELLRQTDLSIAEIAEKAGYEDYFYFSRVFKKLTGTSPRLYRNRQ